MHFSYRGRTTGEISNYDFFQTDVCHKLSCVLVDQIDTPLSKPINIRSQFPKPFVRVISKWRFTI